MERYNNKDDHDSDKGDMAYHEKRLAELDYKPISELKDNCLLKKGEIESCFKCPMHLHDCHLTILIMKCMWCKKFYGFKDGLGKSGISHGVCEDESCMDKSGITY